MLDTLGHYGLRILALTLFVNYTGRVLHLDPFGALLTVLTLLPLVGGLLAVRHIKRMCTRCSLNIPDNLDQAVEQRRLRLAIFHLVVDRSRRLAAIYCALYVIGTLLGVIGEITNALLLLSLACFLLSIESHSQIGPWCPRCHRGGGGGGTVVVPEPIPTMGSYTS